MWRDSRAEDGDTDKNEYQYARDVKGDISEAQSEPKEIIKSNYPGPDGNFPCI